MNNGETQQQATGGGLSQTVNPQAIPSQNLGAPQNNLQSGDVLKVYNSGIKISGVAGSDSSPVSVLGESTPTTTTAETSDQNSNTSMAPIMIGFLFVIIVIAGLVFLAIKKSNTKKPEPQPVTVKSKPKSKKSRSKRKSTK